MKNKKIKILLVVVLLLVLVILIKQNVSAKKEPETTLNDSTLNLEINSDLVQGVYSKLSLLAQDGICDNNYGDLYFDFKEDKKEITNEDELYIALDSLYKNGVLNVEEDKDGRSVYKVEKETVVREIDALFKDSSFEPTSATISPSLDCGIIGYLYTGSSYELNIVPCDAEKTFFKAKLVSASKEENYIKLDVKAFKALADEVNAEEGNLYAIKNFDSDEILTQMTYSDLEDNVDNVFTSYEIDVYTFMFELKGDDYFLVGISK